MQKILLYGYDPSRRAARLGTTPFRGRTRIAFFSETTSASVTAPKAPGTCSIISATSWSVAATVIPSRRSAPSTAASISGEIRFRTGTSESVGGRRTGRILVPFLHRVRFPP